jgi:hypothetical protein
MARLFRRRIIIALFVVLLLIAGGWMYSQRVERVAMEAYVPESALGFLEVNDLPLLADRFTATDAWQKLAPVYGLPDRLSYLGKAGALARWTGIGPVESVVLSRSQIAVAVTGIEVRGEDVRPRLAILAETHTNENRLRRVIEERLPQLAARAYGRPVKEATEYLNVPITVWRAPESERRLLSAQLGSLWIIANHPDSMRACIETRLGRSPSMANSNFFLKTARPVVESKTGDDGNLFAFVSGQGVVRLMQFATNLVAGKVANSTPFAGALEGLLADISARTVDGAAYSASFENGVVVNRYALLCKPALVDKLKSSVVTANQNNEENPRALKLAPPAVKDVTVVSVENPIRALDGLEVAISSQLGAGQSFVLHRLFLGAREALLGLKPNENPAGAFGSEIASISFSDDLSDRVLLIAARDHARLQSFAEKFLSTGGAGISRQKYHDVELMISSSSRRGAGAFIGDFLALGGLPQLRQLIDAHRQGESIVSTRPFTTASRPEQSAAILSFSSVKEETGAMMSALARKVNGQGGIKAIDRAALDQLPLASSATRINDHGLYVESHAPLGNFPLLVSLVEDSSGN